MPPRLELLLVLLAGWVNRQQQDVIAYRREESRVLREQGGGRRLRLNDAQRCRLDREGKFLGRGLLSRVAGIVTPGMVLRWYRELIARKDDGSASRRGQGRPRTQSEIAQPSVRLATEDPRFGWRRIRDVVNQFGHDVSRSTVRRVLAEAGIEPAPGRGRAMPWRTFARASWAVMAAADFFTVEVLAWRGLVRSSRGDLVTTSVTTPLRAHLRCRTSVTLNH